MALKNSLRILPNDCKKNGQHNVSNQRCSSPATSRVLPALHAALHALQGCYGHQQMNSASTASQVPPPTSWLHTKALHHRLHPWSKSSGATMEETLPAALCSLCGPRPPLSPWTGRPSGSFSRALESHPNMSASGV